MPWPGSSSVVPSGRTMPRDAMNERTPSTAALPVDVGEVVVGAERLPRPAVGAGREEGVEHRLPGPLVDLRGGREHAVEVEQHGVEGVPIDRRAAPSRRSIRVECTASVAFRQGTRRRDLGPQSVAGRGDEVVEHGAGAEAERVGRDPSLSHDPFGQLEIHAGVADRADATRCLEPDGQARQLDRFEDDLGRLGRRRHRRLARRRLDEVGAVGDGEVGRPIDGRLVGQLAGLDDHLDDAGPGGVVRSLGDEVAHAGQHAGRRLLVAAQPGAVRQDDVDLVGAVVEGQTGRRHHVVLGLLAAREVDDRGDPDVGAGEGIDAERRRRPATRRRRPRRRRAPACTAPRPHRHSVSSPRSVRSSSEIASRATSRSEPTHRARLYSAHRPPSSVSACTTVAVVHADTERREVVAAPARGPRPSSS